MTRKIRTRTSPERLRRRTLLVIALVVPAIVGAVALPRFMAPDDGLPDVVPLPDELTRHLPERLEAAREDTASATPEADEAAPDPNEPHAGGDLRISLELPRAELVVGRPFAARITLRNLSLDDVHVPAPGEPQSTLRIVVVDESGETVRDICESSADDLLRRTYRLASGETMAWSVDVVAPGESPLPPGTYRVTAVYDADPGWQRTGLPVWTAPGGARRADDVSFTITP